MEENILYYKSCTFDRWFILNDACVIMLGLALLIAIGVLVLAFIAAFLVDALKWEFNFWWHFHVTEPRKRRLHARIDEYCKQKFGQ